MVKSFMMLRSSVLLAFLLGSTLSAPPTLNEPENNQNDLTLVLARLNHLEAKVVRLETELEDEKENNREKNRLQEIEISNLKLLSAQQAPKMIKVDKDVGADGSHGRAVLYPRSCRELAGNGHSIDGIYLIEWSSNAKRIGAVYCEFVSGSPPVETLIGIVDIKSSSVQFYVQRTSSYGSANTVVPWQLTRLNLGNAMNTGSGVFTAPKEGVYHFHLTVYGLKDSTFEIRVNGGSIGRTYSETGASASIHSTVQLKTSDTVNVYLIGGSMYEDNISDSLSHFTGWLDEEDLV